MINVNSFMSLILLIAHIGITRCSKKKTKKHQTTYKQPVMLAWAFIRGQKHRLYFFWMTEDSLFPQEIFYSIINPPSGISFSSLFKYLLSTDALIFFALLIPINMWTYFLDTVVEEGPWCHSTQPLLVWEKQIHVFSSPLEIFYLEQWVFSH